MSLIENGVVATPTPHALTDVRATTTEYLGAGVEDVLLNNSPLAAVRRFAQRTLAAGGAVPDPAAGVYGLAADPYDPVHTRPREVPMLAPEEANRQYGELGLKFEKPIAVGEAELMAETKRREQAANAVFRAARAPAFDGGGLGVGRSLLSVATDFLGSAIDPINLSSAFLPIVGPAGRAALTARLGAVGGGAAAGAIEGAVGNLLLEPLLAGSAIAEQRDYEWYNSVSNVVLGGVLGGGIGGAGGYLGRQTPPGSRPDAGGSRAAGPDGSPFTPGPAALLGGTFEPYAAGWRVALEQVREGPAARAALPDLEAWARLPQWDREAPMVRAIDSVSPETRRIAGEVATMQYLNGRPIDIEPVLQLDPDWRSPMADPVEQLRRLVDQRRIAGYLQAPEAPPRRDPLVDPQASGHFADFDPGQLTVDAKRFQFKAGGDAAGVTDRLKGVTKWDQRLAGLSIVWQAKDGRHYVVDGHQRHGLATRLSRDGQQPKIHAILLKEANGESEGYARALAAFKNIAEGSGTAIDAAKILRETAKDPALKADLDSGRLPQLPPTSALVRDAGALAKLPDDAFGIVAAGKVEPAHAAHVTRILADPKQQQAAIEMLARLGPDTSEQARLIVEQIRAAGFKEGETVDLFGRQDVAASLMLERAKVLEAAARALKKDATVFRTLVEREAIAAEAGNVLARDANVERLSDDRAALAVLEALANRAGTLGTALNEAARALADGKTLRSVTAEFLKAVRAESAALRPSSVAGRLGADFGKLEDLRRNAGAGDTIGDPAALERQNADARDTPADLFGSPQKLAEHEQERLSAEAKQALEAHPELKAELEAAELAAKDADLFGAAADALAGCKITGGQ